MALASWSGLGTCHTTSPLSSLWHPVGASACLWPITASRRAKGLLSLTHSFSSDVSALRISLADNTAKISTKGKRVCAGMASERECAACICCRELELWPASESHADTGCWHWSWHWILDRPLFINNSTRMQSVSTDAVTLLRSQCFCWLSLAPTLGQPFLTHKQH